MTGMSFLVYKCTLQPIGLVSAEYYSQELKYSEQMNKEKNAMAMDEAVDITFNGSLQKVIVKYPLIIQGPEISGEILFFKPDNNAFDFTVPVKIDVTGMQEINASKLPRGAWRVKINWRAKGISYYNEEKIFIN